MRGYERALPYCKDMVIPGFEKSYPAGLFRALDVSPRECGAWYEQFVSQLDSAIGQRYLPVIQMSDGEFTFCVGHRSPIRGPEEKWSDYCHRLARDDAIKLLKPVAHNQFRGGVDTAIPSGLYTPEEWRALRPRYGEMVRAVSQKGALCLHFSFRKNQFAQQYFVPMVRWMKTNGIELDESNFFQKYFVYALLNGPERARILGRQRILVVTHSDDEKRGRITAGLQAEGAREVQFLQISKNRSMYDVLDLGSVNLPVDVVLVGAGIGKPNVLLQLEQTRTLCIDAGFVIECIAYPELRRSREGTRTFCWADFERNGDYTPI